MTAGSQEANARPWDTMAGGRVSGERGAEELRYARLLAVRRGQADAVPTLVGFLGDPAWRVRKAGIAALESFAHDPSLVPSLIAGLASSDNAGLRNACAEALVKSGGTAVAALTVALATPDPDHRKFIVEVLGEIGTPQARDELVRALNDEDVNVRGAAAEALGHIGGELAVAPLRRRLAATETDLLERVCILDALAHARVQLPYDEIAPWVGKGMFARQVCALLGASGDPKAADALVDGLLAAPRETRRVAACSLASLLSGLDAAARGPTERRIAGDPRLRETLAGMLQDDDDALVGAAARLLGATGDPLLAPAILQACACRSVVESGTAVVCALGPAVVRPLLDELESVDIESRVLYLEVIESLGDASILDRMLEIANGPESRSAETAIRVIGTLATGEAVGPLLELVRRGERDLARAAGVALAALGRREPQSVLAPVRAALAAGETRPEWLLVLGALGQSADLGMVIAGVHNSDPAVREAALDAARAYGTIVPVATIIFALTDEHPRVRVAGARALGAYRCDHAIDALLASLRDSDPWVVAQALRGLGGVQRAEAVAALLAAVTSGASPIAIAALQSLFLTNPPGLAGAVAAALRHGDPEVVREAISVSQRLAPELASKLLVGCLEHHCWIVRAAAANGLANRGISVELERVHAQLMQEEEPLVEQSLARLLQAQRGEA